MTDERRQPAEIDALREALSRVPSCGWHGHGAYPETCWWCALNRVIPSGQGYGVMGGAGDDPDVYPPEAGRS